MNILEGILSRRSIRRYNGEPITQHELERVLDAAYAAPAGHARYGDLHLLVITDKDFLARWEACFGACNGNSAAHPFYGAPTVVLVSSVMNPSPMDNVKYSDAAGIVENMALAAVELGIGACHIWGAVRVLNATPELKAELPIPEGRVPCCAIALGHTDEVYALREVDRARITTDYFKGEK